jgi:hypothetical protein
MNEVPFTRPARCSVAVAAGVSASSLPLRNTLSRVARNRIASTVSSASSYETMLSKHFFSDV